MNYECMAYELVRPITHACMYGANFMEIFSINVLSHHDLWPYTQTWPFYFLVILSLIDKYDKLVLLSERNYDD
jgi:hypothetical protein